jgi:hypothetical protein
MLCNRLLPDSNNMDLRDMGMELNRRQAAGWSTRSAPLCLLPATLLLLPVLAPSTLLLIEVLLLLHLAADP